MKVLAFGLGLFLVSVLLQIAVLRIHIPRRQMTFLFNVFVVVLILGISANFVLPFLGVVSAPGALSIPESIHVVLFFVSMLLAYLLAYSAVEADSPSLLITMTIYRAGSEGIEEGQLMKSLDMDRFFESRVTRLIEDRMIEKSDGRYRVAPKGRMAMNIVVGYRRLMGGSTELG